MSAPAIVHNAHEAWLMRRRELITASDVAAILGEDPYRKAGDVYAEKLGLSVQDESWPMRYGKVFQDGVGRAYSHLTGRPVQMASLELPEITTHPDITWLGATLDGDVDGCDRTPAPAGGGGALETKVSSVADGWREDELPVHFQLQVTVQLACSRRLWGAIAAFVSLRKPPRAQDVVFDRELFDLIVPKLDEFRHRLARKDPPADDVRWWSHDAIRRVYADDTGAPIALDAEALQIAEAWEDIKAARREADERADELADKLRLRMGAAPIGYLPDGSALTLKTVKGGPVSYQREAYRRLLRTKKKGR